MRIEILTIAGCPNGPAAERAVHGALAALDLDIEPTVRVIACSEEATDVPFAGSPTVLVDGTDAVPGAEPIQDLACRMYLTPSGPAGHPTAEMLIPALRAALAR